MSGPNVLIRAQSRDRKAPKAGASRRRGDYAGTAADLHTHRRTLDRKQCGGRIKERSAAWGWPNPAETHTAKFMKCPKQFRVDVARLVLRSEDDQLAEPVKGRGRTKGSTFALLMGGTS